MANSSMTATAIAQQQQMAMQAAHSTALGSITTTGNSYSTLTPSPSYTYYPGGTYITPNPPPPEPYVDEDDSWGDADNQEAAGFGWMLTDGEYSPKVVALSFGSKKEWSEERILQDVVEQSMTGSNAIAYKILCLVSKNRSPYSQWSATCAALSKDYESDK
jgi:hypothetical protein